MTLLIVIVYREKCIMDLTESVKLVNNELTENY